MGRVLSMQTPFREKIHPKYNLKSLYENLCMAEIQEPFIRYYTDQRNMKLAI